MNDREIFAAAIKLTGDQRIAFLDAACDQNESLRNQVDSLLSAHEDSNGPLPFVNDREIDATHAHLVQAVAGSLIGPYKLLEEIGEGGMGSVWVAQQSQPIRRKVAIKLIKLGMDSKAVLARFEAERQALAMMDHPNIARVLDGGVTDEGRPYFAMEYVKGVPFIEYCDSAKLSVRERLELFVPICKAVQHAHQKGVIHRDLKPSNILVCLYDGIPVPKVIDFGLAKAVHQSLTEKTLYTAQGIMVGTPLYMSPEQAESNNLDVDTRTDIYSLGVILYELLTGSTPLEKAQLKDAAVNEILRLIKEVEPPKPSTRISASHPNVAAERRIQPGQLTRSISGDLDWVVMKALEKERSRRYETASGLAEDIRRHLSDEPVSAGPPSAGYTLRKFIKRNRTAVAAGSFVAAALIVAVVGTTGGMFWALNEREEAEKQRARAEQREEEAIDAVRRFGDSVANNPELKNRPELESLRKTLLQEPLAYFKSFGEQLEQDTHASSESLARLAKAAYDLALLTNEIGNRQDALTAYRQALAFQEQLVRDYPTVTKYRHNLAQVLTNIGNLLRVTGQSQKALAAHEKAMEILKRLVEDDPNLVESQYVLAKSHHNIALLLSESGQRTDALAAYQQAMEIRRRLVQEHPDVAEYQNDLAAGLNNMGNLLRNIHESLAAYQQALAIRERLVQEHPDVTKYQSTLAISYDAVASIQSATGRPAEAMHNFQQALKIRERLARDHPSVTAYQSELAHSHYVIGHMLYHEHGQPDEALEAFRQAIAIQQRLVRDHPKVTGYQTALAGSLHNIGQVLSESDRPKEALEAFRQAQEIQERLVHDQPDVMEYQGRLAGSHNDIGLLLSNIDRPKEALDAYEKALEVQERMAQDHPEVAEYQRVLGGTLNNMAMFDLNAERFSDARNKLTRAIEYQKRALAANPKHPVYREFLGNHYRLLARAAEGLDDVNLLLEAHRGLVELARSGDGTINESYARAMNDLIWDLVKEPTPNDQAQIRAEDVSEMRRMVEQFPNSMYLNTLAVAEYRIENYEEAIAAAAQSLSSPRPSDLAILAMSLSQLGQLDRANVFRAKFNSQMRLDEFNNDEESKLFQGQVNILFDQQQSDSDATGQQPALTHTFYANCGMAFAAIGEWEKAIADYDQAVGENPELRQEFSELRGRAFAALGEWKKAADVFAMDVGDWPNDKFAWLRLIPVLVLSGDRAALRNYCQLGLSLAEGSSDPEVADVVCKLSLLLPNLVDVKELPINVVSKALQNGSTPKHLHPWFWACKALVAYRQDDPASAVEFVRSSQALNPSEPCQALGLSIVAMAQHSAGHQKEAAEALKAGKDLIDRLAEQPTNQGHHDLLIARILHDEAGRSMDDSESKQLEQIENSITTESPSVTPGN